MTTVVVTQQPGPQLLVASVDGHRDWTSGVCSCFDDCSTCKHMSVCSLLHVLLRCQNAISPCSTKRRKRKTLILGNLTIRVCVKDWFRAPSLRQ